MQAVKQLLWWQKVILFITFMLGLATIDFLVNHPHRQLQRVDQDALLDR
ncbi:MAG: hypothetical protein ABI599_11635 [Flavobacteriales bacterium]